MCLYNLFVHFDYTVSPLVKTFKSFRFDPELYGKFKELTSKSGLMVTEAFEKFMAACIESGAIIFPEPVDQRRGVEAEARVLLAWLKRDEFWYRLDNGKELSVVGRLLTLLSRIQDEKLHQGIEDELKKKGA